MKYKNIILLLIFFMLIGATCNQRTVKLGLSGFCPPGNNCTVTTENSLIFWSFVNSNSDYFSHHTDIAKLEESLPYFYSQAKRLGLVVGTEGLTIDTVHTYSTNLFNKINNLDLEYVCIGNEINNLANFLQIYPLINQVAGEIKAKAPFVRLCTTLQYESLMSNPNKSNIVSGLTNLDFIGYTVYPFIKYTTVSLIPTNYLDFAKNSGKPFGITEISWPTNKPDYTNFVSKAISILPSNTLFINYYSPYDMVGIETPFNIMGLCSSSGACRTTATQWNNLYKYTYVKNN